MSRNILYIVNPISGTRSKKDIHQLIEKKTAAAGIPFKIIESSADGNYEFLEPVIQEERITDIVIAGGDGTVNQVVGSLLKAPVCFGIIPCGSGNGLAYAAKIPKNPEKALKIILDGKASAIDGFYLNGRFACMLCGLGYDAQIAHDFAKKSKRGFFTYFKQALINFWKARPFPFHLQQGEKTIPIEAFFISIANSNQFGNHFTIAPKASLSDGLLDIVVVTSQSKVMMIVQTLRQLGGFIRPLHEFPGEKKKDNGVVYFQTDRLIIHNPADAPLHLDGEPVESHEKVEITVSRNCFRLLQPSLRSR